MVWCYTYCMSSTDTILLEGVVGSHAYGLNHEQSDVDTMGVFAAPTLDIAGLYWSSNKDTKVDQGPTNEQDSVHHEVAKYMRNAIKCSPHFLELLYLEEYTQITDYGESLVGIRDSFLFDTGSLDSDDLDGVRKSFFHYSRDHVTQVKKSNYLHPKTARNALRAARNGRELVETGTLTLKVDDPQEYWDLTEMEYRDMMDKLNRELDLLLQATSVLPETPDTEGVISLLRDIRAEY